MLASIFRHGRSRLLTLGIVGTGRLKLGETHLFPVPSLATPAKPVLVDDACPRSATPCVFSHGELLVVWVQQFARRWSAT